MRLSAVDIGTNTVRLLIVDSESGRWDVVRSEMKITRLGERLSPGGRLYPIALERTGQAVVEYARLMELLGSDKARCVATSAVREAIDGAQFAAGIKDETGLNVEILDAQEEAKLTLAGVLRGLGDLQGPIVLVDIGGGSTEIIYAEGQKPIRITTTDLGVVRLTERFIKSDPIKRQDYLAAESYIEGVLAQALNSLGPPSEVCLVGTAGTVTTLAAVKLGLKTYSPEAINKSTLLHDDVSRMLGIFLSMSAAERSKLDGLEKGREDIIVAGALVVKKMLELFGSSKMVVSDFGLREGLIVSLEEQKEEKKQQPAAFKRES